MRGAAGFRPHQQIRPHTSEAANLKYLWQLKEEELRCRSLRLLIPLNAVVHVQRTKKTVSRHSPPRCDTISSAWDGVWGFDS
eukprot:3934813-Rhodomonas_salina.3